MRRGKTRTLAGMPEQTPPIGRAVQGFFLFAGAFVASLLVFPLSIVLLNSAAPWFTAVIPGFAVNLLFFWPQLLIFPSGITTGHTHFGHDTLGYTAGISWIVIALGFAWYTRNVRLRTQGLLIFPVIIAVGLV